MLDAEQDQPLRRGGRLSSVLVVKVHLFEGFEDVIETPQTGPALLILCVDHQRLRAYNVATSDERAAHLVGRSNWSQ